MDNENIDPTEIPVELPTVDTTDIRRAELQDLLPGEFIGDYLL